MALTVNDAGAGSTQTYRGGKKKANTQNASAGKPMVNNAFTTKKAAGGQFRQSSTGGGGGGAFTPTSFSAAPMADTAGVAPTTQTPTPPQVSDDDWLAGDSTYQAALAALKKTLSGYQTQYDTSKTNYDTDYNSSLKNLGWRQDSNDWNADDNTTAYGRSYSNQLNDFAARDMLQSSFYGDAFNDLLRQFNDQKGDLSTARNRYMGDLSQTLAQQKNENTIAAQQARAESIARKAAGVTSY